MRFYESGGSIPPSERVYKNRFSSSNTRYIYWELNLKYPQKGHKVDFEINAIWYRSDGSVLTNQTKKTYIPPNWTGSYHVFGYGSKSGTWWFPDKYKVELYIEGKKVSSGTFEVFGPRPEPTKKPILTIETGGHKVKIHDVIFTSDGKYLVSASDDKTIRVWDTSTGEIVRVLRGQIGKGHEGKIFAVALSPDDQLLAVGGYPLRWGIRIIDFQNGEIKALLKGHENVILGLAFSPDGNRLISGSSDKTARIWDVRSQKTIHVLKGHTERIYAVAFSPDGTLAVTGSYDDTLKLWNAKSGSQIKILKGHSDKVRSVAFTPDGKYILSGSWDKTIRMWGGRTGEFIKVLAKQNRAVGNLSISPDSEKVLSSASIGAGSRTNNVFSIPSGDKITSFTKHRNIVLATDISPDGRTAATGGGSDMEIYLWDLTTGKVKQKMVGKGKRIWNVGFAKDGRSIAWGRTVKSNWSFNNYGSVEQSFQIKSDSRTFELSMEQELKSDVGFIRAIESTGPWTIRTPNGKIHKTLEILKNGGVIHEITRGSIDGYDHRSLTLTTDGLTVISGGMNGSLYSYNQQTGKKIHEFVGHTGDVWGVAASPDSRFLVSGSDDQTVRLWEIDTGKLLLTIFQGTDNEWVVWTPEGYYTSSLNGDKYIGWHLNNGENKVADYYSAFQFERILYRPDYVNAYLKYGGDKEKVESTLGGNFFNINNLRDIAPPKIKIISPSYGKLFSQESRIPFKLTVESSSIDMLNYSVFVNNIPVTPSSERILQGPDKRSFVKEMNIPLFDKKNKIRVEVFNGKSMGLAETVVYKEGTFAKKDKGDLYLLSVGVNEFSMMPSNNLYFAAHDAKDLEEFFRNEGGNFFRHVFTKSISDFAATKPSKDNIIHSLDFIKNAKAEDTVIIFLASHGLSDPAGNYYFVPGDANVEDLNKLTEDSARGATGSMTKVSSLISWEAFFDALRSVPGKRLLVVDTCQAKNIAGTFDIHSLAKRSATSSFALLAASKGNEESQEYPQGKHGLFTYAILKGLSGDGDSNGDGKVVLSELYDFIGEFVERNRNKEIGKQTPQLTAPKELKDMVLAAH